jgi:hypothetical protein
VCKFFDEAQSRITPMLDQALPAAVETAQSLSAKQIAHIERKYAKVNKEFKSDYLQADLADRADEALERTVKRAEMIYGNLDGAQRERLKQAVAASPFDPQLVLEERQLRQQETLKTLRKLVAERATAEQTLASLRMLAQHAQRSPREAYASYQQRLNTYNCNVAAQLHNSVNAAQRAEAVKKLKSWEEDARSLAAEAPK